jgi:hypothetical protein
MHPKLITYLFILFLLSIKNTQATLVSGKVMQKLGLEDVSKLETWKGTPLERFLLELRMKGGNFIVHQVDKPHLIESIVRAGELKPVEKVIRESVHQPDTLVHFEGSHQRRVERSFNESQLANDFNSIGLLNPCAGLGYLKFNTEKKTLSYRTAKNTQFQEFPKEAISDESRVQIIHWLDSVHQEVAETSQKKIFESLEIPFPICVGNHKFAIPEKDGTIREVPVNFGALLPADDLRKYNRLLDLAPTWFASDPAAALIAYDAFYQERVSRSLRNVDRKLRAAFNGVLKKIGQDVPQGDPFRISQFREVRISAPDSSGSRKPSPLSFDRIRFAFFLNSYIQSDISFSLNQFNDYGEIMIIKAVDAKDYGLGKRRPWGLDKESLIGRPFCRIKKSEPNLRSLLHHLLPSERERLEEKDDLQNRFTMAPAVSGKLNEVRTPPKTLASKDFIRVKLNQPDVIIIGPKSLIDKCKSQNPDIALIDTDDVLKFIESNKSSIGLTNRDMASDFLFKYYYKKKGVQGILSLMNP